MKALLIDKVHPVVEERIGQYLPIYKRILPSQEELAAIIGEYEILIMRVDPPIDKGILDKADKLRIIAVGATGLSHIDLDYAQKKGITVLNVPATNYESVAELTIGRIIDLLRYVPQANRDVKEKGIWDKYRYLGHELEGKTLGLVALGKIGSRVAELARAFGMNILAFDPFLTPEQAEERGARLVSLEELFRMSDIISLHAPLTPETRHMINTDSLSKMKDGSYLINMGRGELVDEDALYTALKEGKLAGAGGDVMADEPRTQSPLFGLDNFIITPHIGAQTEEAQFRIGELLSESILDELSRILSDKVLEALQKEKKD